MNKIILTQREHYTHPEAFLLTIEHHADGSYTYVQAASSVHYDVEDLEAFRQELLSTGWTFHSSITFK
jgi:hypothetical protein